MSAKQLERDRKRRESRRALVRRVLLVAGSVAAIAAVWVALVNSSLFTVTAIEVEGAVELSRDEVLAIAAIEPGATLLRIDEDGVRERLSAIPWVAHADVVRSFPSTAIIRIEERERFAMIDAGSEFWAVDRYGRVLGESIPQTSTPTPVVRDIPGFAPTAGELTDSPEVMNAIKVLAGVSPELRGMVKTVSAPSVTETALITASNVEVMLGKAEQLTEKSALALEIMTEQGSDVVFVDVRSLERPVSRGLND